MPLPNHSTKKNPGRKKWFRNKNRTRQHFIESRLGGLHDQKTLSWRRYVNGKKLRLAKAKAPTTTTTTPPPMPETSIMGRMKRIIGK